MPPESHPCSLGYARGRDDVTAYWRPLVRCQRGDESRSDASRNARSRGTRDWDWANRRDVPRSCADGLEGDLTPPRSAPQGRRPGAGSALHDLALMGCEGTNRFVLQRTPSHCSAPNSFKVSTCRKPNRSASLRARTLAACVHNITGSSGNASIAHSRTASTASLA